MRNVFTTVFAVAGLAILAAPAAAQAPKLGYVDSGRIIAEAPGAKEAQATFEKDMDRYRTPAQEHGRLAQVDDERL